MEPEQIRANIACWQQRLQEASGHFGGVEICAVTKTHAAAEVNCAADAGMKAVRLDVYENNLPAIRLYESCGFDYIDSVDLGYSQYGLDSYRLYQRLL